MASSSAFGALIPVQVASSASAASSLVPLAPNAPASASLLPTQVKVTELDPVILIKSANGGWIKIDISNVTSEQKKELVNLYDGLKGGRVGNFLFHLSEAYAENGGQRDYNFQTDSPVIKRIRALVAELLHHKDRSWEEYPAYFRTPADLPSMIKRLTPPVPKAERVDDKELSGSAVDRAKEYITACETQLETLANQPKLLPERKTAIEKAQQKLNKKLHKRAVHFAVNQPANADVTARMKSAETQLGINPDKDREYLEDVIRLTCKDRGAYLQDTAEIQALYDKENSGKTVGMRRDGLEALFIQLVNANNDLTEITALLNGPLFSSCFADTELHEEDRKALVDALVKEYTKGASAGAASAPSLPVAEEKVAVQSLAQPSSSSSSSSAAAPAAPPVNGSVLTTISSAKAAERASDNSPWATIGSSLASLFWR